MKYASHKTVRSLFSEVPRLVQFRDSETESKVAVAGGGARGGGAGGRGAELQCEKMRVMGEVWAA